MRELVPFGVYRHFKGKYYLAEGIAINADTGEKTVVYRALYGERERFVRPLEEFLSPVDRNKYPDAKQFYRFEEATPSD